MFDFFKKLFSSTEDDHQLQEQTPETGTSPMVTEQQPGGSSNEGYVEQKKPQPDKKFSGRNRMYPPFKR